MCSQSFLRTTVLISAVTLLAACGAESGDAPPPAPVAEPAATAPSGLVEMTVEDFAFVAPPQVASGWTTFRMTNAGEQPHFMILWRLPEGVDFAQYAEIATLFQTEYTPYHEGEATEEEMINAIVAGLPEWFPQVVGAGGVALTSAGQTAETMVLLEPGNYVMECYVGTPEGIFHGTHGMLRPLIVTEEVTGAEPPAADVQITLTGASMQVEGELGAGEHIIAVTATDTAAGLVRHDVNLARIDAEASLEEIGAWMNWVNALRIPTPATFLGGADHLEAGATAYFRVTLEPGNYAFISEAFATQGAMHAFTVSEGPN